MRLDVPHPAIDIIDTIPTDTKIVYRRYASLFFIAGCDSIDNELITLEIVHRYVEQMDKYYGNVCELDIIFNFQKAYFILDELLLAGEMQESSKKNVLRVIGQQDSLEDMEVRLNPVVCHLDRSSCDVFSSRFVTTSRGDTCSCVLMSPMLIHASHRQVEDEGVTKIM